MFKASFKLRYRSLNVFYRFFYQFTRTYLRVNVSGEKSNWHFIVRRGKIERLPSAISSTRNGPASGEIVIIIVTNSDTVATSSVWLPQEAKRRPDGHLQAAQLGRHKQQH